MGKRTPFGDVLRRLRLRCGLTQQAVADALHTRPCPGGSISFPIM